MGISIVVKERFSYGKRAKGIRSGRRQGVVYSSLAVQSAMKRTLKSDAAKVRWSEYSEMDFDRFWKALRNLKTGRASSIITCTILLDGWNFIEDMGRTFNLKKDLKRLHSRLLDKAYEKLFCGCNLPAVTPEGKSYSPLWSHEEILSMRAEFREIWRTFRNRDIYSRNQNRL